MDRPQGLRQFHILKRGAQIQAQAGRKRHPADLVMIFLPPTQLINVTTNIAHIMNHWKFSVAFYSSRDGCLQYHGLQLLERVRLLYLSFSPHTSYSLTSGHCWFLAFERWKEIYSCQVTREKTNSRRKCILIQTSSSLSACFVDVLVLE